MIDLGKVNQFFDSLYDPVSGGYRYSSTGPPTLYGTCFALMTKRYLGVVGSLSDQTKRFLLDCQNPETGWLDAPELSTWEPVPGAWHSREHVMHHVAVHALPAIQDNGLRLKYPLADAHKFLDPEYLASWLDARSLKHAWLEGNNILFVGQFLVYLRDVEKIPAAQAALDQWFAWLDKYVDPATGLWGTNGFCSPYDAVYGGYHQLLVYYYEKHPLTSVERLIDTTLALQFRDGGFSREAGGGACEDVDAVDILVNCYKLVDYRRPDIRVAVRRCVRLIESQQNPDGGFPYKRNQAWSHLGVPATSAVPNQSHAFGTWFRVHTIALAAQILGYEMPEGYRKLGFNEALSMGWHRGWDEGLSRPTGESSAIEQGIVRRIERDALIHSIVSPPRIFAIRVKSKLKRAAKRLLGRSNV